MGVLGLPLKGFDTPRLIAMPMGVTKTKVVVMRNIIGKNGWFVVRRSKAFKRLMKNNHYEKSTIERVASDNER